MNILILGSTGMIGRNLKEGITGHTLICPTHAELDVLNTDSVYNYFMNKDSIDLVINCVSIHTHVFDSMRKAFFNVLRYRHKFKKMIYFGSWGEHNRDFWHANMREDEFFMGSIPLDEYGLVKNVINRYINEQLNNNVINLRLFGTIGKYDFIKKRFLPDVYSQLSKSDKVTIFQNQTMDLLYVDDIVKIVQYFIDKGFGEHKSYNLCTGRCELYSDIVEKIGKISGRNITIETNTTNKLIARFGNNDRLLSHIGDFKFTSIDEALKNSHDWYKENHE